MPGSILPLPVMLEEEDRKIYEALEPPKSLVIRYGYMRMVAELPNDGTTKVGCGSKLVVRTARGIELGEMLTTTCPNSGCSKAVSRREMLDYIDNSGGKNYPFSTQGKVLRVATVEDLNEQARLDARRPELIRLSKGVIRELDLPMKLVDVELLLGGERIIFHYTAEEWVDFRELVRRLAAELQTRIEMHQVSARDEARITADYEKCGQHCCCRQFLKVLKPVNMRSAKVQKATLDPAKISGRCGRLMCCLRYEDQTYEDLRKRLPKKQTRVMSEDGPGTVLDTQILTQLVLVILDNAEAPAAIPLENLRMLTKEEDEKIRAEQAAEAARRPAPYVRGDRPGKGPPPPPGQGPRATPGQGPSAPGQGRSRPGDRPGFGPRDGKPDPTKRPAPGAPDARAPEPRRPQPGQPLREEEIESREGEAPEPPVDALDEQAGTEVAAPRKEDQGTPPLESRSSQPVQSDVDDADNDLDADEADESADEPAAGEGPSGPTDGTPAGAPQVPGAPGAPGGRKRRRRRRRRRGGGPGPAPGGPPAA